MNGTSRGITQRALAAVAMLILGLGAALIGVVSTTANASVADNVHQIRICHATGSESNPYTKPWPTKKQISNNNGHKSGGGVHPGDIIPPFDAGSMSGNQWGAFGGQNWDAAGQEIWNNNCNIPEQGPGEQPDPETRSEVVEVPDCEATTVTSTTTNYKTEYVLFENEWVLGDEAQDGEPIVATRDMTEDEAFECAEGAPSESSVPVDPGNPGGPGDADVLGIEANAPAAGVAAAAPTAVDAGVVTEQSGSNTSMWLLAGAALALMGAALGLTPARARGKRAR